MIDTTFIDELASGDPTPGGGGASAYAAALAAALGSMVCNLTIGKKKYADVETGIRAALGRLEQQRARLIGLVDADAKAFAPLAAAYRMPKGTPEEAAAKHVATQKALVAACDVPLEVMRTCYNIAEDIDFVAHCGSRMVVSDAGVAASFTKAALQAAALNVFINVRSMEDADLAAHYRAQANEYLATTTVRCDAVYGYVWGEIR